MCVCVCEFFWVSWCDDKCARASKRPLMTHLPSEYVPVEHLYTHTLPINGFAFENKIHHLVCFILKILLPVFGIYYTGFWCDVCGIFVFLLFFLHCDIYSLWFATFRVAFYMWVPFLNNTPAINSTCLQPARDGKKTKRKSIEIVYK